jgi:hypothetical protein
MLGPSRPLPCAGGLARIKHFGGGSEDCTIIAVEEEGRRVRVRTLTGTPHDTPPGAGGGQASGEEGDVHEFVLSPSSARFLTVADAHGPRLELLG